MQDCFHQILDLLRLLSLDSHVFYVLSAVAVYSLDEIMSPCRAPRQGDFD